MSGYGILDTLLEVWLVHKATLATYDGDVEDRYHQLVPSYSDPVAIPDCRLYDLVETEIISLAQTGVVGVSKKLLVPPSLDPAFRSKVSNFLTNGKDINGISDIVVDPAEYEVAKSEMRRSTIDEFRELFLRRLA